jgi:hypothetical protein
MCGSPKFTENHFLRLDVLMMTRAFLKLTQKPTTVAKANLHLINIQLPGDVGWGACLTYTKI